VNTNQVYDYSSLYLALCLSLNRNRIRNRFWDPGVEKRGQLVPLRLTGSDEFEFVTIDLGRQSPMVVDSTKQFSLSLTISYLNGRFKSGPTENY
jgi:hypothetical protein